MNCLGIDVGGTCAKLSWLWLSNDFLTKNEDPFEFLLKVSTDKKMILIENENQKLFLDSSKNIKLYLYSSLLITSDFPKFLEKLAQHWNNNKKFQKHLLRISLTGGGSKKYEKELKSLFPKLKLIYQDEIEAFSAGVQFTLKQTPNLEMDKDNFLLVCIGTGTSIIKVSNSKGQRIGGSLIGGGTFFGLASQLSGIFNFQELMELAKKGNHQNVDMLVGDIYGEHYGNLLGGDIVASSFAKLTNNSEVNKKPEDMVQSLIFMISATLSQLAALYHKQTLLENNLNSTNNINISNNNNNTNISNNNNNNTNISNNNNEKEYKIIFAGGFLSKNLFAQEGIQKTLEFWGKASQQKLSPHFSNVDSIDYSGSIGCLILSKY